jgi:antitoxin component YwqK of YwqJK toxin-antitoxin module
MMKQGRRYTYYPNGQLQLITHYENDKITGERLQWATNGTLIERGNYKSGSRSGKFEGWWEDGSLKEISYHRGYYKHGPVLRWHRDGRILEQGTYYDGKAIGIGTVWDTLGNLYGENGGSIEIQQHNWYYRASNIREYTLWYRGEGRFKNGMRDGKWKFYYKEKGKNREPISGLCAVVNYKKGVLHGKVTVYHQNGGVLLKAKLKNGWLEGDYITYHETGDIAVKGKFKKQKWNDDQKRYSLWLEIWSLL